MKPVLILIAGGSASGKSTVVDKIQNKLNSIYGMSVMNPCRGSIDFINGEFIERAEDPREMLDEANRHAFQSYAWGVWTTALARAELEKAIKLVGDGFLYCDTDSVKYTGDADFSSMNDELKRRSKDNGAMALDSKGKAHYLGVWEYEGQYKTFRTWGAKKYAYTDDDGLHVTIAGVNKKKGAEELQSHGGLTAFRPGFTFRTAGGTESVYNDEPDIKEIEREGHKLKITSNLYMYDSMYTVGITGEYLRILERAEDWKKSQKDF